MLILCYKATTSMAAVRQGCHTSDPMTSLSMKWFGWP